jgi:hypothetical protein
MNNNWPEINHYPEILSRPHQKILSEGVLATKIKKTGGENGGRKSPRWTPVEPVDAPESPFFPFFFPPLFCSILL